MKIIYWLSILPFLTSCSQYFQEDDLLGYYSPIDYAMTYDTIQLKPNGIYHRKTYDKNNKLVLEMDGKWTLKNNSRVNFYSFFLNLDRDVSCFPEILNDTVMTVQTNFELVNGTIQFCTGYYQEENCYHRINSSKK